jgi:hypothetical protein
MQTPVPALAEFLRWMNETPVSFLEEPECFASGKIIVRAVIGDLFETYFGKSAKSDFLQTFEASGDEKKERNRLRWILMTSHLLWHPLLRERRMTESLFRKLLVQDLAALAAVVPFDNLMKEPERQEELVRRVLQSAELLLPGEHKADADDRLSQINSIERHRLVAEAAAKEKRAREVREEMLRKAAAEAAAKVSRE